MHPDLTTALARLDAQMAETDEHVTLLRQYQAYAEALERENLAEDSEDVRLCAAWR